MKIECTVDEFKEIIKTVPANRMTDTIKIKPPNVNDEVITLLNQEKNQ